MGFGQSKLMGPPSITREQLLRSTANNREFLNNLFKIMMEKLTPEDVLKLGRSQTCTNFVFMMADSIGQLFDDLRIRPSRKGDSGIILFEKVDTLKKKTAEHRELCLFVAYFFIRIFQIFGSVAMTILDDPGAGQVLGAARFGVGAAGPKPVGPRRMPGERGAWLGVGGAEQKHFLSGKSREFLPIRDLLDEPVVETTSRGNIRNVFTFLEAPRIHLIPERMEGAKQQNLRIDIDSTGHLYGNLKLTGLLGLAGGAKKLRVTVNFFRLQDSTKDATLLALINKQIAPYTANYDVQSLDNGETWLAGSSTFTDKLNSVIEKVFQVITQIEMDPTKQLANLKLITKAERAAAGIVPREGVVAPAGVGAVAGRPGAYDVAVSKPLQNEYIINILKQLSGSKTVSFCVARALQLLDANTLYQPKTSQSLSGVCKGTFEVVGASVPQAKASLDKVPGLKAVDQLFYTQPSLDQRNEFVVKVGDLEQYAAFLKDMSDTFGRGSTGAITGIDKILVKDPNCPTTAVGKYLQIQDPKAVQKVLGIIGRMFGRQKAHTEAAIKFLTTRLFKIQVKKDPRTGISGRMIDINPAILQKGIEELNSISREARNLLIQYYKGCEDLYQEGAKEILSAKSVPV